MVDEREDPMDLDLNLEPSFPPPTLPSDVLEERIFRERIQRLEEIAARSRGRWRRRWREGGRLPSPSTASDLLMEVIVNAPPLSPPRPPPPPPVGIQRLLTGEGSVSAEERSSEICKSCKGRPTHLIARALEEEKGDDLVKEKESNELKVSFFDCNICFDMASDPVLTSCGHLFCWGCLYQWINVHSDTKECPVCKGEVTEMNITPIYGRGGGGSSKTHQAENKEKEEEEEVVKELKIPPRPHARRIESLRQSVQRVAEPSFTIEELLQQYDSMFDVYRGFNRTTRNPERSDVDPQLDPTHLRPLNDIIDLTQDTVVSSEAEGSSRHRVRRRPFMRPHLTTRASASYLPSSVTSGERSVESYIQGQPVRRNQSQSPPIDDRDSFSSIVAVMNSDSQTVDTAIEIDSMVSPTSSSSRRRRDTSSVSDVNRVFTRSSRRRSSCMPKIVWMDLYGMEVPGSGGKTCSQTIEEAGCATPASPSCAACLSGPKDTYAHMNEAQVCISTTNRNFPGRMRHKEGQIYLASPYTSASSALTGFVTDPRDFLQ